jgi:NADPH-dependent 2,4-dienoyl-CoA reductase/sulfur reductase-like enzyme
LCEECEIIILERGPHVSFANCGLPYFVGGEIPSVEDLLVQTPESLRARFRLDVRVLHEAIAIDRDAQRVTVRDLSSGEEEVLGYDALVLATGAGPLVPPIPGIDNPGHFAVRTVPDVTRIRAWIDERKATRAVVVGGGYIGLEMAEQLVHHGGLAVTVVEAQSQVMAPFDPEMAAWLHAEARDHGIDLRLGSGVAGFESPSEGERAAASVVVLKDGHRAPADLVILGLGVRPETGLAKAAGLEIGARGGIRVNEAMQTSDPAIYAVGDVVEVRDAVSGEWTLIPLAGPANRQGRLAMDRGLL